MRLGRFEQLHTHVLTGQVVPRREMLEEHHGSRPVGNPSPRRSRRNAPGAAPLSTVVNGSGVGDEQLVLLAPLVKGVEVEDHVTLEIGIGRPRRRRSTDPRPLRRCRRFDRRRCGKQSRCGGRAPAAGPRLARPARRRWRQPPPDSAVQRYWQWGPCTLTIRPRLPHDGAWVESTIGSPPRKARMRFAVG